MRGVRELRKMMMKRAFNVMVNSEKYTIREAVAFARKHTIGKPYEEIDLEIIDEIWSEIEERKTK